MKKLVLGIALAAALSGGTVIAQDHSHDRNGNGYSRERGDWLERHVNHLNRMVQHVRWQLRQYHADWRTRRDFEQVSREADRLNHRFRSGDYNSGRLRDEVERLHARLHGIEQRLHVRSHDFYRWD